MNITLYHAAHSLADLLDQIDPDTGELPEGFEAAREVVIKKGASVIAYILTAESHLDMVKAREKELADQRKRAEKRLQWLRQYLAENMAATGITRIQSEDGTFGAKLEIDRDALVDVFEPELLPADYMREIPAKQEPDKALIAKAIADGFDVPGARIVRKNRLTLK